MSKKTLNEGYQPKVEKGYQPQTQRPQDGKVTGGYQPTTSEAKPTSPPPKKK